MSRCDEAVVCRAKEGSETDDRKGDYEREQGGGHGWARRRQSTGGVGRGKRLKGDRPRQEKQRPMEFGSNDPN
jgi:hypothetical protein